MSVSRGKLLDTSPSEMGLEVPCEFEAGEVVRPVCNGIGIADGVVKHCRSRENKFFIGIETCLNKMA